MWPQLGAWGLGFAILASMWRDQRRILHQVRRVDTLLVRLTFAGLAAVSLLPFPTTKPGPPSRTTAPPLWSPWCRC